MKQLKLEFMKLKRSPLILLSILGISIVPLLMGAVMPKTTDGLEGVTFAGFIEDVQMVNLMIMGILMFGLITSYTYSKEFEEDTLKSTLAIPVRRSRLLLDKFIVVFAWVLGLLLLNVLEVVVIAMIFGLSGLNLSAFLTAVGISIRDTLIFMPLLTPIMFVTLLVRKYVAGIVFSITVVVVNIVALSSEVYYAYYPYTIPLFLAGPVPEDMVLSIPLSVVILGTTGILGAVGSLVYFQKMSV
mgnify:CR=1 FL=1